MDQKVEEILICFLKENCLPQKTDVKLDPADNLFNTGILDSAGLMHFVGFIETTFDFSIPDEDLIPQKFSSITSIADYIRTRIEEPVVTE